MTESPTSRYTRPPHVRARAPVHPALWTILGIMVAIELVMSLADRGLMPGSFSRWVLYSGFGFFDTMFEAARQDGTIHAQLLWSLVTHAFLHGGWLHLGLNGAAFIGLGHALSRMGGIRAVLAIFLVTAVAGAVTFGIVAESRAPLVGASGVVFGFLGTLTAWQEQALRRRGAPRDAIWARVMGVIFINVIMAGGAFGGIHIAWEAHLGGFAAGWLMASVYQPKSSMGVLTP